MRIEAFKPRIVERERYAVVVPCEGGIMAIIQTYHNLEQLETGYREWKEKAERGKLTRPYPVELLDNSGKCKILTDLLDNQ